MSLPLQAVQNKIDLLSLMIARKTSITIIFILIVIIDLVVIVTAIIAIVVIIIFNIFINNVQAVQLAVLSNEEGDKKTCSSKGKQTTR